MKIQYTIVHKAKTLYFDTMELAIAMARFIGFPINNIKEIHLF